MNRLIFISILAGSLLWFHATAEGQEAASSSEHRIDIRTTAGGSAEFFDRSTGQTFIPRGTNYVELVYDPTHSYLMSSLFLPGYHDHADVEFDFERMEALGYNTARIFVDLCRDRLCIGDPSGGLRDEVMDNVVSLLYSARRHGVFVLFTANWLPDFGGYLDAHQACTPTFELGNCLLLHAAGVASYRKFFADFVQGLIDRDAPLDVILGYQLRNEVFFESDLPPLNQSSGTVTTANGRSYDMASQDEKLQMVNDGLVFWADEVSRTIRALDSTALVGAGFFPPSAPHEWRPGDPRLVRTRQILRESNLDFLDFHGYPAEGLTMEQMAENYGMPGFQAKPVILGEFGPFLSHYDSPAFAAPDMQRWQSEACAVGFDGYLYWMWDPDKAPRVGDSVWGVHDGTGEIARALAPVYVPDPCADGVIPNLARGKPATASRSLEDSPPADAFDGDVESGWVAGDGPIQWIEVDLGTPQTIGRMALRVDQFPAGNTVHQISGQATSSGPIAQLHEFSGSTEFGQWLEVEPDEPWTGYRFIRVTTTESPSWVAWFEIEIYPPDTTTAVPLPPDLMNPAPFEENLGTRPVLNWSPVATAESYRVQVADTGRFGKMVFDRDGLTQTSVTVNELPDDADYFWRVRAKNDDGAGPWSAERRFTVGTVGHVGISGDRVPERAGLAEVFPNPFFSEISFEVELERSSRVELEIFDVQGRSLGTVVSGRLPPGEARLVWNPGSLPSGLYLYRLVIGGQTQTGAALYFQDGR